MDGHNHVTLIGAITQPRMIEFEGEQDQPNSQIIQFYLVTRRRYRSSRSASGWSVQETWHNVAIHAVYLVQRFLRLNPEKGDIVWLTGHLEISFFTGEDGVSRRTVVVCVYLGDALFVTKEKRVAVSAEPDAGHAEPAPPAFVPTALREVDASLAALAPPP